MNPVSIIVPTKDKDLQDTIFQVNQRFGIIAEEINQTDNNQEVASLDTRLTTTEGDVIANATATSALDVRVTANEGDIIASATDITNLETTVNDPVTGVVANSTAVNTLDSRVTLTEGELTAQASDITQLQTDVGGNTASIATNATAISTNSGAIATNTTNITANEAAITSEASARSTADGFLEGKYTLNVSAGNVVTGMNITSASGGGTDISDVTFNTQNFKIYDGSLGYAPFEVDGGVVYMKDANIRNLTAANITAGSLTGGSGGSLATTTVDTDNIVNNAVTIADISNDSSGFAVSRGNNYNVIAVAGSGDSNNSAVIQVSFIFLDGTGTTNQPQLLAGLSDNVTGTLFNTTRQFWTFTNGRFLVSFHTVINSVTATQYQLDVNTLQMNGTGRIRDIAMSIIEFKK